MLICGAAHHPLTGCLCCSPVRLCCSGREPAGIRGNMPDQRALETQPVAAATLQAFIPRRCDLLSLFLPKLRGPTICPVAPTRVPARTQHAGTAPLRPSDPTQNRKGAANSIGKRGAKSPRDASCNGASKHWSTHPSLSCQGGCQAGSFTNLSRSLLRCGNLHAGTVPRFLR